METKWHAAVLFVAVSAGALHAQQPRLVHTYESAAQRIVRASDADQVAYLNLRLNQGLRQVDDDAVGALLGRSSLVLPIIERKVEEVLRSKKPQECFTDKAADPNRFVDVGAGLIASAGDEYAMKEIAKLVVLDEKRFGGLVIDVLVNAQERVNPFAVAYKGLDIGDPKVDKQVVAWAELILGDRIEAVHRRYSRLWAEAMVEKYGDVPLESKWAEDPIASRINREIADSVHDDVLRLAVEAREKQTNK